MTTNSGHARTFPALRWSELAAATPDELRGTAHALATVTLPPVNAAIVSPFGFDATAPVEGWGVLTASAGPDAPTVIRDARDRVLVELADRRVVDLPVIDRTALELLRRLTGVRVDRLAAAGPFAQAVLISQLLVAGIPVAAPDLSESVRRLLGPTLSPFVHETPVYRLGDAEARAAWSLDARRAALLRLTSAGGTLVDRPTVTVIALASDDEVRERLRDEIAAQDWPALEVLTTRGTDDEITNLVANAAGHSITVMSAHLSYPPQHVTDLVLAQGYGRQRIVGTTVRRTYLEAIDMTVEEPGHAGERATTTVTAGAILVTRDVALARPELLTAPGGADLTVPKAYATHHLGAARIVPRGNPELVDHALSTAEHQWPGGAGRSGQPDPAYASYFVRTMSRAA